MHPLYEIFGDHCPNTLVRQWNGPLLPEGSDIFVNPIVPGKSFDIFVLKVADYNGVITTGEPDSVEMYVDFGESAVEYIFSLHKFLDIVEADIGKTFLEAMKKNGWSED